MTAIQKMRELKWGVFNHYICSPGRDAIYGVDLSDWNATVDSFDTEALAKNLHEMGAGYYFITLIHGTEYMLAPNPTYDRLMGVPAGVLCPHRDLVADIYESLKKYGIKLCLYFNCLSPFNNTFSPQYRERVGIFSDRLPEPQFNVLTEENAKEFVQNWSAVLRDFTLRYGDKISAWWLDSCYTYAGYTDELLSCYYDAIKAGNPNAIIGFNKAELLAGDGSKLKKSCKYEELTCGEHNTFDYFPTVGEVDGALTHLLIPLGKERGFCGRWCSPETDYTREFIRDYISRVNEVGGIVTVDIFVTPDGSFTDGQKEVLTIK